MSDFAGMRLFVSRPAIKIVDRTWRERLFTLPWRPFEVTRTVIVPAAVPADECYRVGNDLHCGERFFEKIKEHTARSHP